MREAFACKSRFAKRSNWPIMCHRGRDEENWDWDLFITTHKVMSHYLHSPELWCNRSQKWIWIPCALNTYSPKTLLKAACISRKTSLKSQSRGLLLRQLSKSMLRVRGYYVFMCHVLTGAEGQLASDKSKSVCLPLSYPTTLSHFSHMLFVFASTSVFWRNIISFS